MQKKQALLLFDGGPHRTYYLASGGFPGGDTEARECGRMTLMRVKAIPTLLMAAALFVSACGGSSAPVAAQPPATTQAGSSSASPSTTTPASAIVAAGAPTATVGAITQSGGSVAGPTAAPIDKSALLPGGFGNVDT